MNNTFSNFKKMCFFTEITKIRRTPNSFLIWKLFVKTFFIFILFSENCQKDTEITSKAEKPLKNKIKIKFEFPWRRWERNESLSNWLICSLDDMKGLFSFLFVCLIKFWSKQSFAQCYLFSFETKRQISKEIGEIILHSFFSTNKTICNSCCFVFRWVEEVVHFVRDEKSFEQSEIRKWWSVIQFCWVSFVLCILADSVSQTSLWLTINRNKQPWLFWKEMK